MCTNPGSVQMSVYRNHQLSNLVKTGNMNTGPTGDYQGDNNQYARFSAAGSSVTGFGYLMQDGWYTGGVGKCADPIQPLASNNIGYNVTATRSGNSISIYCDDSNIGNSGMFNGSYHPRVSAIYFKAARTTGVGINNRWITFQVYSFTRDTTDPRGTPNFSKSRKATSAASTKVPLYICIYAADTSSGNANNHYCGVSKFNGAAEYWAVVDC